METMMQRCSDVVPALLASVVLASVALAGCASDVPERVAQLEARVRSLEVAMAQASAPMAVTTTAAVAVPAPPTDEPGWVLSGGGSDVYTLTRDPTTKRDGKAALLLAPAGETEGKYATWMRVIDASEFRGKRVRVTVFTRTAGTSMRADFWARVQGKISPGDGRGLGGGKVNLPENSDWAARELVFDVPADGSSLQYGVGIAGRGRMWLDAPAIEVVGEDVPVTAVFPGEKQIGPWLLTGVGAPDFSLTEDGNGVRLEPTVATPERFVAVVQRQEVATLEGKKANMTFEVKTDGLGQAGGICLVKAQREKDLAYSGFLGFAKQDVAASTKGFVQCKLSLDVPKDARYLLFGFSYRGAGKVWLKGGTFEVK